MCHPRQIFSRKQIYELIRGLKSIGDNISMSLYLQSPLKKTKDSPSHTTLLQTVWGAGNRLNKGDG